MKKFIKVIFTAILALTLCTSFTACKNNEKTIVVGASPTPHAKILEVIKNELANNGWTLEIKEYSDYILPNVGVNDGSLDANYFQHLPYLNNYNAENGTNLVSVAAIHYEPFALFGNGLNSLENIPAGTEIFIPNDNSNGTRALFLLAQEGLISLPEGASAEEGVKVSVVINPNNYAIIPVEAKLLVTNLNETNNCLAAIRALKRIKYLTKDAEELSYYNYKALLEI